MENLLIDFNKEKYDSDISSLQNFIDDIQGVIRAYNSIGIAKFEKKDFDGLFFDTENFIFEKMMKDKPAEVFGMKINKKKFWDEYLVKPKGYFDVMTAIGLLEKKISIKQKYSDEGLTYKKYLSFFEQVSDGKFEIKESKMDEIKSKHQTYVYSEKGQLAFEFATLIEKFLNKNGNLAKLQITNRRGLEYFVGEAINIHDESVSVRKDFITCAEIDHK